MSTDVTDAVIERWRRLKQTMSTDAPNKRNISQITEDSNADEEFVAQEEEQMVQEECDAKVILCAEVKPSSLMADIMSKILDLVTMEARPAFVNGASMGGFEREEDRKRSNQEEISRVGKLKLQLVAEIRGLIEDMKGDPSPRPLPPAPAPLPSSSMDPRDTDDSDDGLPRYAVLKPLPSSSMDPHDTDDLEDGLPRYRSL